MRHVVPAQLAEVLAFQAEVVQRVVGHVVDDIAEQESARNAVHIPGRAKQPANYQPEQPVKQRRHRQADHRGHDQARFLARLGVVHAVHQE